MPFYVYMQARILGLQIRVKVLDQRLCTCLALKNKLLNSFKSSYTKLHNLQKFMLLSFVSYFCQNMVFVGHFLPSPSNTSLIAFHSAIDSIFVMLNFKTSDFYNFSP